MRVNPRVNEVTYTHIGDTAERPAKAFSRCPICGQLVTLWKYFETYYFGGVDSRSVLIDDNTILQFCDTKCKDLYLLAPILHEL